MKQLCPSPLKTSFMDCFVLLLLGLSLSAVSPVHAADLASALNTGKVCEMLNGYIQATPGNEAEMSGLVSKVNDKRKLVYADIATREGIDPAIVGSENAAQEKAAHPEKFCP